MVDNSSKPSGIRPTIAFLTGNAGFGDNYQGALRWGVEHACRRHNANLFVYVGRTDWNRSGDQHKLFYLMNPERIDAIVFAAGVIAPKVSVADIVATLSKRCKVPLCVVGHYCPGVPNVLIDNRSEMSRMMDHLIVFHRFRHFACIAGPSGHYESDERLAGIIASMERHQLTLPEDALVRGDFSCGSGSIAFRNLFDRGAKPEVVVCANDEMAVGAMEAARALGLHCPEDIAITGFDDAGGARFSRPPLTTVRQPITRLGETAVDYVMTILKGEEFLGTPPMPTELMIRDSCGCKSNSMIAFPSDSYPAPQAASPPLEAIDRILSSQFSDEPIREVWTHKLIDGVRKEIKGKKGAFHRILDELLAALPYPYLPANEFQYVITLLSRWAETLNAPVSVNLAFQTARVLVGNHVYQQAGEKQHRDDAVVDEIRVSWGRRAGALSLPGLKDALQTELPKLGIKNALIALFESTGRKSLVPWVCLQNGIHVDLECTAYPSEWVFPKGFSLENRRQSLTILPLTFEAEMFGIAIFEFPIGIDAFALLREQISSALRTVRIHEDFLAKDRLHQKIEEEHRLVNERLSSLSVIAGGVAHDLNNVLGPMTALPDTIEFDLKGVMGVPEAIFSDLELIRIASRRAAHTIQDLFILGHSQETPRTYLSLNHLLTKERASFQAPSGYGDISVEIEIRHPDLVIQGSKPHIVRAISNLVLNAVKAVEGDGRIRIVAKQVKLDRTLAGTTPIPRGDYAVVSVEDNGCGIPDENLHGIMEPFFTASRHGAGGGTGLGLAIVRRIVQESGGYIHVESALRQGTTFSLYFPSAERQIPTSTPPSDIVGGIENILVVDDETVQLRAAQRMLKHLGYQVTIVQSGEAALDLFAKTEDVRKFDLVIVDMLMPGLSGIETVEQIRRYRTDQKAVIASGYAPEKTGAEARAKGMAWLAKPFTLQELAKAIRKSLDEESPHPIDR